MRYVSCLTIALVFLLSACTTDNGTDPDVASPAMIQDLMLEDYANGVLTLTWAAPGDDGNDGQAAEYDIRYSANLLSEAEWGLGVRVDSLRVPKAAGQVESLVVSELADSTWHFCLKTADEVPNWSAMSNIVSVTIVDTFPPSQVTDLAANLATMASIALTWTTPGDNATEGQAYEYDLRYALEPITEENWDEAIRVEDIHAPDLAGSAESCTIANLESGVVYSFAIKTIDDSLNESELSNVVNRSTAYMERLTYPQAEPEIYVAWYPKWSPDGLSILFNANWGRARPYQDLYTVSANGGQPQRLTFPTTVFDMVMGASSWSPDGRQLAFVYEVQRIREIYTMNPTPGAEMVQISNLGGATPFGGLGSLSWSPDGSQLAFATSVGLMGTSYLYTISSSGGGAVRRASGNSIRNPCWSSDGTLIFFQARDEYLNEQIWSVGVLGGVPKQLTTESFDNMGPALSPDGSQIAFSSDRSGDLEIWTMSTNGENPTQLTFGSRGKYNPSWSPDGSRMVFSVRGDTYTFDLWILVLE